MGIINCSEHETQPIQLVCSHIATSISEQTERCNINIIKCAFDDEVMLVHVICSDCASNLGIINNPHTIDISNDETVELGDHTGKPLCVMCFAEHYPKVQHIFRESGLNPIHCIDHINKCTKLL